MRHPHSITPVFTYTYIVHLARAISHLRTFNEKELVACAQLTGDARYSAVAVIHPIIWGAFAIGCLSMQLSQTYDITSSTLRFIYCSTG